MVGHAPGHAHDAANGGTVHDCIAIPALGKHLPKLVLHAEKNTAHVGVHNAVEFGACKPGCLDVVAHDAGVVVGIVQSAESLDSSFDHVFHCVLVRHVAHDIGSTLSLARNISTNLLQQAFAPASQHDAGALPGKHACRCLAYATGGSGHQSNLVLHVEHLFLPKYD